MSKFGVAVIFVLVVAVLAAGAFWLFNAGSQNGAIAPAGSASTTPSGTVPTLVLGAPTGTAPAGDQSISDGSVTLVYPTADFALATSSPAITAKSYIPPCDPSFDYCLYYIGSAYQGTNFDSAGIRVEQRTDLTTQNTCLTTAPDGFASFTPTTTIADNYAVSEFAPIGNAGAGHYSAGTLYRLEYNGACYELETRIGVTQFANYPAGTIKQFTAADQASLQTEIRNILNSVTLPSGETVAFPN